MAAILQRSVRSRRVTLALTLAAVGCASPSSSSSSSPPPASVDSGGGSGGQSAPGADANQRGPAPAGTGGATGSGGSTDGGGADSAAAADSAGAISPPPGSGTWTDLAPMPGGPRSNGSGALVNGWLFAVGGSGANSQDVEAYNPKTNTWETHVMMPVGVNHANVAGVGDKLYVMGGRGSAGTFVYNPFAPMAERKWTRIAQIPGQREAASVGVIGGKIYLVGGAVTGVDPPRGDVFVYDPATDTWDTTQPPIPVPRTHAASAVINDILYIAAGRKFAERFTEPAGWMTSTYAYDPRTRQWSQKKDAITARSGCMGATIRGLLIVAGGEGAPGGGTFPQVEAYNPDTDQWTALAPMKHSRNGQAEAGIDDKVYMAGGAGTDVTDALSLP